MTPKVKLVTPIRLDPNVSKTSGDAIIATIAYSTAVRQYGRL